MRRGEIYWADPSPRSGSEQKGRRPVVVVSHDGLNEVPGWRTLIVVPCSTSNAQAKRGLTSVFLPAGTGGIREDSVALCHQVTTLDRSKLESKIGELSASDLEAVGEGLMIAQGLK